MEFSFMSKINASKEAVWEYYADIQKWYVWEKDLVNITLENGFKNDSIGLMELKGMPPMEYTLVSVIENQTFWVKTKTPFGSLLFGHEIHEIDANNVQIKHIVRLESETMTTDKVNILKQIFADVPNSVMGLKGAVENNA